MSCLESTPEGVERDVLIFLAHAQKRFIYASNGTIFARGAPDYDVLVDNLATAFADQVRNTAATV
jgi:hypothetical protein